MKTLKAVDIERLENTSPAGLLGGLDGVVGETCGGTCEITVCVGDACCDETVCDRTCDVTLGRFGDVVANINWA